MKKTLISTQPFLIKEASNLSGFSRRKKLNESIDKNGGRLIVSGVLQRANH
jgi:hypothetical protein